MTENQNAAPKKGCGPIFVALIALFCLTMGFLVGAGGLFGFLYLSDDGVYQLGLAERQAPAEAVAVSAPRQGEVYALVYPIQETIQIQGALDEGAVRTRLNRERFDLQECYTAELSRSAETRGEMSLQFTVSGSNGKVIAAVNRGNYTGSEQLSRCVLDKVRQWSFPAPDTSQVAVVRFDVLFLPFRADEQ